MPGRADIHPLINHNRNFTSCRIWYWLKIGTEMKVIRRGDPTVPVNDTGITTPPACAAHRADYEGHPGIGPETLFNRGRTDTVRVIYFQTQMGVIFDNGTIHLSMTDSVRNYTIDQELETK